MKAGAVAVGCAVVAALLLAGHTFLMAVACGASAAALAALAARSLRRRHYLARHRSRHLRWRLRLRLHPGPGHATVAELFWRWGRLASWRESRRTRPSLRQWHRLIRPASHSFYLGRAHHHHGLRVSVQEHGAVIGPPRSYKSALLARLIADAPGAVVSTSSKPDIFTLTSGLRARKGPVWVFNPQGIGGIPSNVRWSPLDGCLDPSTAIRRADAFAQAVSVNGTDDGTFWAGKASDGLRGMFAAAALAAEDMRRISRWIGSDREVLQAVAILDQASHEDWAAQLAELTGAAEKTAATVRMVMSRAIAFLNDPALAAAVTPPAGEQFDIDSFLRDGGTLYMIARGNGEDSVLGPLFAALATEVHHRAVALGSRMPGGRLDPPLLMALDEVTQICPVPLPSWLADAGGQGVSVWSAFHGMSQLRARWKEHGAQAVLDTSNVRIFLPGLADTETLDKASKLCGQAAYRERGEHRTIRQDVMTPGMIRQLPPGFALLLRGGLAPVVGRMARGWEHRPYRRLARRGEAIAQVTPVMLTATAEPVPAAQDAAPALGRTRDLVPVSPNGNGHRNGDHPWSA